MNIKQLWKIVLAIAFSVIMIFTGFWIWTTCFNMASDLFIIIAYVSVFVISGLYITGMYYIIKWILKEIPED